VKFPCVAGSMGERAHKDKGNNFFKFRELSGTVEAYAGGTGLYEEK